MRSSPPTRSLVLKMVKPPVPSESNASTCWLVVTEEGSVGRRFCAWLNGLFGFKLLYGLYGLYVVGAVRVPPGVPVVGVPPVFPPVPVVPVPPPLPPVLPPPLGPPPVLPPPP